MDENPETEGMGAAFWLMLCLGIVGLLGFFFVAGGAVMGGM